MCIQFYTFIHFYTYMIVRRYEIKCDGPPGHVITRILVKIRTRVKEEPTVAEEQPEEEEKEPEQEKEDPKLRKKHKLFEKTKKRKDSIDSKKRKVEDKRHADEMAERRKQRELRSLNRDKVKTTQARGGDEPRSRAAAPGSTTVGRQTNNSLASATGQIVIQSVSNPNRKKLKTSQVFGQSSEDLVTGMYKILEAVKNHEDAWPFVEAVEEEYAPNYYSVIRRPMDLQRMEDKLDAGLYLNITAFTHDFQLIVDNCRLYNGTDNEYTEMVDNLQQAFQRATDRYLDQISSSDEEIAVEFQQTSKGGEPVATKGAQPGLKGTQPGPKGTQPGPKGIQSGPQNKRKKNEPAATTVTKRKPTSMAQVADKRDRSASVESSVKSETDTFEKLKNDKNQKSTRGKSQQAANKFAKNTKNDTAKNDTTKNVKHVKKNKKAQSPSPIRSRSRSRSPKKNSKSPSWPPSSPEYWTADSSPPNRQKSLDSSDDEKASKTKGKHKHWKEVFKDKKNSNKVEKEVSKPKELPKHKDKNIKLKETIEKLKAKSELALSDDGILRSKHKEEKLKEKPKPVDKETVKEKNDKSNNKPVPKNKAKPKEPLKPLKNSKEFDFDDEDSTKDSSISDSKKETKKVVKKAPPVKNVADIDALAAATEQTLKDINKWLDDTPRFSEFSSASNSPSHFIGAEETDPVASKIEQDYRKTLKMDNKPVQKTKENVKDLFKRRLANKDTSKLYRRREIQRTIERLQPGKSKGNLLSNMQNANKPEELFPLGPLAKLRESRNSLVVKPDDTAPKLSLGSVLDSFGQQHNFNEDIEKEKEPETISISSKDDSILNSSVSTVLLDPSILVEEKKVEVPATKDEPVDNKPESVPEKKEIKMENKATPNLSAWFKAFGAPKVQATQKKKQESEEEKKEATELTSLESSKPPVQVETKPQVEESRKVVSPELESPAGQLISRQRRGSTGSSISEQSSFSQDMDSSPRMSIDERLGAYPAPYPSPLHRSPASASPVMASPRQEEPQRPYPPLNGSIRVGFYQDTVSTKSSPDKSCSPRDQPHSPYQQYPEHVYLPPNTIQGGTYPYANPPYYSQQPPPAYANTNPPIYGERTNPPTYYDTTKPLTDQYNAKVPPTAAVFQSEENVNSPEPDYKNTNTEYKNPNTEYKTTNMDYKNPNTEYKTPNPPIAPESQQTFRPQICVPEKQPTMFPVKKRLYSESEMSSRLENTITIRDEQDISPIEPQDTSRDSAVFGSNRSLEMGLMTGRQLNISTSQHTSPIMQHPSPNMQLPSPNIQHPTPNIQDMRPASREQTQYLNPQGEARNASPGTYSRPDSRGLKINKPFNPHQPMELSHQANREMNVNMQLPNQLSIPGPIRPMNFPTTSANIYNLQNHESAYSLNMSVASRNMEMNVRQEAEERKMDISKLTNMGYLNPSGNVDMTRSAQYQTLNYSNRPPSRSSDHVSNSQSVVQPPSTEHMNLSMSMRYPDSRVMSMGYRPGMEPPRSEPQTSLPISSMQNSDILQVPQGPRTANRMAPGVGIDMTGTNYKAPDMTIPRPTFNTPSSLGMEQSLNLRGNLANLSHIVDRFPTDERLLQGLQPTNYYSDKGHMFSKGIPTSLHTNTATSSLPMFSQPNIGMSYGRDMQQTPSSLAYSRTMTELQNPSLLAQAGKSLSMQQQQQQPQPEKKPSRKRKSKQAAVVSVAEAVSSAPTQGFQSYAGLKNSVSSEPSAISLKTASVVPGSAFNFGPTPTGLGLPPGLYGDKDGYPGFLDEYRPPAHYNYMAAAAAAAHRATPDSAAGAAATIDKGTNVRAAHQQSAASTPPPPFPFLGQARPPGYPSVFMGGHQAGSLMDAAAYQQYLGLQGLLPPPAGYPPGYHPALSMRQPYDSMTRPWL